MEDDDFRYNLLKYWELIMEEDKGDLSSEEKKVKIALYDSIKNYEIKGEGLLELWEDFEELIRERIREELTRESNGQIEQTVKGVVREAKSGIEKTLELLSEELVKNLSV
ncbi:MAG: hypothetical protein AABX28_01270 [Nanoarchaeota archaeon]